MRTAMIRRDIEPLYVAGYDLIPLLGKRPITKNWVENPRTSLEILKQQLKNKADNVGIRLGRPLDDGRYLCVIDVDIVGELVAAEGLEVKEALNRTTGGVDVSRAPSVTSGFGHDSRHIYVATDEVPRKTVLEQSSRIVEYMKAGKDKSGPVWKIEIMGWGAQCVIPPSVHPDTKTAYQWKNKLNGVDTIPTVVLPAQRIQPQKKTSVAQKQVQSLQAGFDLLSESHQDLVIEGDTSFTNAKGAFYESPSEVAFAAMTVLVRNTQLTDKQIVEILLDPTNKSGASPRAKTDSAGWVHKGLARLRSGMLDTEVKVVIPVSVKSAGSVEGEGEDDELLKDPVYKDLWDRHSLVTFGGKLAVFRERNNPDAWENRFEIMPISTLTHMYENKLVPMGNKNVNPVDLWRASKTRKEFLEGVCLAPDGVECPVGRFNLWRGYAVEPAQGSVKIFTDFILKVICDGNKQHAAWLIDWIADLFQNPADPKGVSVVMRGAEGIGKGTLANTLGYIIGSHFRHITQESQLTGRFNSHFADSTLIFGDEMTWGGDKKHRGVLYALITERLLMVERKNFDAVPMRNFNRIIIASNNDWVVPTNIDGRRWFVLDPSNAHKLDTTYFCEISEWLNAGGYSKLLYFFQNHKITSDLRLAPSTKGLVDQKMNALDPVHQWWAECLDKGSVAAILGSNPGQWPEDCKIGKDRFYDHYVTYCKDMNINRIPATNQFMRIIREVMPSLEEVRSRTKDGRTRVLVLPSLDEATEYFQGLLGVG